MNGQDTRLFYIYGWRGQRGPFFVGNAITESEAIAAGAGTPLKYSRVEVHDVRENRVVWSRP